MTIAFIRANLPGQQNWSAVSHSWRAMPANSDGEWLEVGGYTDRSLQVSGVLSGATVVLDVSNEETPIAAPGKDPQENVIAISSYPAGYNSDSETVSQGTRWVRVRVLGGDGNTLINATLHAKGPK